MDIGAVVLKKILAEKSLEGWSKLKVAYLDSAYSSLYTSINKFYSKYDQVPGFEELKLFSRDNSSLRMLASLEVLEIPEDIDIEIAIDALINQYVQNEALTEIDRYVDKISIMDANEVKDNLAGIVMRLDEKTHTSDKVYDMSQVRVFKAPEADSHIKFPLGLSNKFDATIGGAYRQELILVGGKRGSGKSTVCSNVVCNQFSQGNSAVYFTIEMRAEETVQRNTSILAGVSHLKLRQGNLEWDEQIKVARALVSMYDGGEPEMQDFLEHRNPIKLEAELARNRSLREDNQIIIVDDPALSLSSIDLHLQKLKAKFKDKLTVAVVDYINQVVVPGNEGDMYDWKPQIHVAKKLKEFARKYDIMIFSAYQIDDDNKIRYAKGILDSPDISFILDTHRKEDNAISFNCNKIRSGPPVSFTVGMNWESLAISPVEVQLNQSSEDDKPSANEEKKSWRANKTKKESSKKVDDSSSDIPPWEASE